MDDRLGDFHLRRPDGEPARLRGHAHHRAGRVGIPRLTYGALSAVLRRAVELGVDFIDTADAYGPYVSEELIRRGPAPLRSGEGGDQGRATCAPGPNVWAAVRPTRLPAPGVRDVAAPPRPGGPRPVPAAPHRPDDARRRAVRTPARTAGRGQGPRRRAERGQRRADRDAARRPRADPDVQNLYNLRNRASEDVLETASANDRLHPVVPGRLGSTARPGGPLDQIAVETGWSVAQLSLA